MSLGRAIGLGIAVCLWPLVAQDCPPIARVLPNGTLAGALDAASCQLGDRTPTPRTASTYRCADRSRLN